MNSDRERQGVIDRVNQEQKVVKSDRKHWGIMGDSGEWQEAVDVPYSDITRLVFEGSVENDRLLEGVIGSSSEE